MCGALKAVALEKPSWSAELDAASTSHFLTAWPRATDRGLPTDSNSGLHCYSHPLPWTVVVMAGFITCFWGEAIKATFRRLRL